MPAPPVVRHARCKEGAAEVLRQLDTHHPGQPAHHVHAAGEVHIQPNSIEHDAAQHKPARQAAARKQRVRRRCQPVGDDQLFEIPPQQQREPGDELLRLQTVSGHQLRSELLPCGNRALRQLREVAHKQPCPQRVLLRLCLAAVDVNEIPRRLEREIAQSHRHKQFLRNGRVFEQQHRAHVKPHQQRQHQPASFTLKQQPAAPHQQRHDGQMRYAVPAGQPDIDGACRQQHRPADAQRQQIVQQHRARRKQQKFKGEDAHAPPPDEGSACPPCRCRYGEAPLCAAAAPEACIWAAPRADAF